MPPRLVAAAKHNHTQVRRGDETMPAILRRIMKVEGAPTAGAWTCEVLAVAAGILLADAITRLIH
jgi:hypothetical protein